MKSRKGTMSVNRQTGKGTTQALKKSPEGKYHQHNRDISSKNVFDNRVLCAQFLRDNFDIPQLKNVQPEDIKDISERFHPYLGTEFQPDSVKKIRILDIEKEPSFLVSLIDHKSLVDYDVPMQLLRYMVCIWTEYRREKEKEQEGSTRRKDFRYPVIIPIVYFEGKEKWTAARNFCERINQGEQFRQWIPDFESELVSVHEHSDEELLERGDEISLVMLINKIQDEADLENFIRIPADRIDRIVRDSPEQVLDIIVSVMESLCFKMDISAEERAECVRKVRERKMGYLWENMEKFSIQEERRKTEQQRKLTEKERKKTEAQRKKTEAERKKTEAERKKAVEQQKRADEQQRRAEEERRINREQRRIIEEERARADMEHNRAREAEEKLRKAEEMIRMLKGK